MVGVQLDRFFKRPNCSRKIISPPLFLSFKIIITLVITQLGSSTSNTLRLANINCCLIISSQGIQDRADVEEYFGVFGLFLIEIFV